MDHGRDAHRNAHRHIICGEVVDALEALIDALENGMQSAFVGSSRDGDGKLVTAHATGNVGRADDLAEDLGNASQDLVPHRMTIGIVDTLEIVEIDHEQGEGFLALDHGVDLHRESLATHEMSQLVKI